jgi:hypothetical protein
MTTAEQPDPVRVPSSPAAPWIERLLWLFMFSFAFDYRASVDREAAGGSGIDQLMFLACCALSLAGIFLLGWRHLLVRPVGWMIASWGTLVVFLAFNAFVQGVDPGRSLRTGLPFGLCLAGMAAAHIAACSGLPASRIVAPVFAAACVNIVWRIAHGFLFKEISMENVRVEVLSPATNWLAAWIGCALLLRGRFHPALLLACCLLAAGILITVTRALMFPVLASALASSLCFVLGCTRGIFEWRSLPRKLLPLGAVAALGIGALGVTAAVYPALIERWNERLFHHAGDRNVTMDVSWMTRRAEAEDIVRILNRDPVHFIHGMGIGASYTWSMAYIPELRLVYPKDAELGDDVWFAGHSTWTYALFSGGVLGVLGHLILFGGTALLSLRAALANSRLPGPEIWLAFLPFVATACFLSESATSNPFYERLAGMLFGVMAGLPQVFFVRASFLPRPSESRMSAFP